MSGKTHSRHTDLQLWQEQVLSAARGACRPHSLVLAALAHASMLNALERIIVLTHAPTPEALRRLDLGDVELLIQRGIPRAPWNPDELLTAAAHDLRWLRGPDRDLLWVWDKRYPAGLRSLFDPPAALFTWGGRGPWSAGLPPVAMVGTRRPDDEGRRAAFSLGSAAADAGFPVVSGLALGIDSAAHRGAIAAGGGVTAIAVLGSGIDTVYPRRNREFAAGILDDGGALVSEYPPGTAPARFRFPARNRIIAALSEGLVLFQAPEASGALQTVQFALQTSRPVMVHASGLGWRGCTATIAEGAQVVSTFDDLTGVLIDGGVLPSGWHPPVGRTGTEVATDIEHADEARKLALFGSAVSPPSVEAWRTALQHPTTTVTAGEAR